MLRRPHVPTSPRVTPRPHSAPHTVAALAEASEKDQPSNVSFSPLPLEMLTPREFNEQRETSGSVTGKQVLTLGCVSDLAGRLWLDTGVWLC